MNIVLAGMPCSGKTTVAEVFAKRGKDVVDTDNEIVKKHGTINDIFARYGENYFRDIETLTIKQLSNLSDVVISTGGGALLREENVRILKSGGKIVYLRAQVQTLIDRAAGNTDRPLLQGDTSERIKKLYKERAQVYERAADFIIDTDCLSPENIADKITELFR